LSFLKHRTWAALPSYRKSNVIVTFHSALRRMRDSLICSAPPNVKTFQGLEL